MLYINVALQMCVFGSMRSGLVLFLEMEKLICHAHHKGVLVKGE
jgi:hypothetical protein